MARENFVRFSVLERLIEAYFGRSVDMVGVEQCGRESMTKQQHVSEAVYHHQWTCLEDWVSGLDALADLSDDQIDQVSQLPIGQRTWLS